MVPESLEKRLENWRSEESRPFRSELCLDKLEYLEEFWKPKEICCYSDFSENHSKLV